MVHTVSLAVRRLSGIRVLLRGRREGTTRWVYIGFSQGFKRRVVGVVEKLVDVLRRFARQRFLKM